MKRILLFVAAVLFILGTFSSCVAGCSMKRDCQGIKHVRLKNGIYI